MTDSRDANPLLQLQQAAASWELTMTVKPLPRTGRMSIQKGVGPGTVFNAAAEFVWQVVGDSRNIAAFLAAAGSVIVAYLAMRGSRHIRIRSGDTEVEVKGFGDVEKALAVFRALQSKDDD